MKKRIVLLGPPASGKGTQAEMIHAKYHLETPSVGAILREAAAAGTELGLAAETFTKEGRLVPDEMIVGVVKGWLDEHDDAFVFDGFPRTVGQGAALERMLVERKSPLEIALAFDIDMGEIKQRVARRMVCGQCGGIVSIGWQIERAESPCPRCGGALHRRKDDTLEALEQRMAEYHEKTEPLIPFYESRGLLRRIPAQDRPEAVFTQVAAALES